MNEERFVVLSLFILFALLFSAVVTKDIELFNTLRIAIYIYFTFFISVLIGRMSKQSKTTL